LAHVLQHLRLKMGERLAGGFGPRLPGGYRLACGRLRCRFFGPQMADIEPGCRYFSAYLDTATYGARQQAARLLIIVGLRRGEPAFEYMPVFAEKVEYFE